MALPVHAHQQYGSGPGSLDSVLEPGTFAVDPLPSGSPWRRWAELEPDGRILLSVLARLPEVRQPWLRAIYDRGRPYSYSDYVF
ncbi:hypothetical protein AB0M46_14465 [Dactylosporangium sp. NPDC051485]|uniref:hypothetical protein n=1 Tax=Dactylosporangium sp. NPDC051485 TaxID=3154846 RepID=UPI0034240D36